MRPPVASATCRRLSLDPRQVPQVGFAPNGLHHDLPGALFAGLRVHLERDQAVGQPLEIGPRLAIGARRLALDGDQVIALLYFQARLGQRRARVVGPVLALVNPADLEEAAVGVEVRAQHAHVDPPDARQVAAAHIGVRRVQLRDHLADDVIQVAAMRHPGQQGFVAFAEGLPVGAAHFRIPVEIAFDPPRFVQQFLPLVPGIGPDLHLAGVELAIAHILARRWLHDSKRVPGCVQHLASVRVQGEAGDAPNRHFVLPLLDVEDMQRARGMRSRHPHLGGFHGDREVEDLVLAGVQQRVEPRRHRHARNAFREPLEVDLNRLDLVLLLAGFLVVRFLLAGLLLVRLSGVAGLLVLGLRFAGLLGFLGFLLVRLLLHALLFVALRREGRGLAGLQREGEDPGGVLVTEALVEVILAGIEEAVREEIEKQPAPWPQYRRRRLNQVR